MRSWFLQGKGLGSNPDSYHLRRMGLYGTFGSAYVFLAAGRTEVSRRMVESKSSGVVVAVDKGKFDVRIVSYAFRVEPKLAQAARICLAGELLELPRHQFLIKGRDSQDRFLLLLRHAKSVEGDTSLPLGNLKLFEGGKQGVFESVGERMNQIRDANGKALQKLSAEAVEEVCKFSTDTISEYEVNLGYNYFGHETILRKTLPSESLCPSSYELVGHILHLNLKDEQLPYKHVIGQVLLDKIGGVKTVVNKVEPTGGPFRVFQMERLAGEDNYCTKLKENGCFFEMDFSKVYWNSRLETEHRRIIDSVTKNDLIADAFAGIGPFTIPAAKLKKCRSYANDLNPDSVEAMKKNALTNKVSDMVVPSCGDARHFLLNLIKDKIPFTHVIMNFPSGAPEFLDLFRGAYKERRDLPLPKVFCYCFASISDPEEGIKRVCKVLYGEERDGFHAECRVVRNVSPKKSHVCISFTVPEDIAYMETEDIVSAKRQKLE